VRQWTIQVTVVKGTRRLNRRPGKKQAEIWEERALIRGMRKGGEGGSKQGTA